MSILNQKFVFAAIAAEDAGVKFPLPFEDTWNSLGYSRKDSAKRALVESLIENEDYFIDSALKWNRLKSMVPGSPEYAAMSRMEFIFLSTDGADHFAMMAQTPEGREARKQMIQYKKAYRAQLERSLSATINPQIDPTRFDFTFDAAVQITGHRNKYQSQKLLLTYLDEGTDYRFDRGQLFLSNPVFYAYILAGRAMNGIDADKMPTELLVHLPSYIRVCKVIKTKNTLFPKPRLINVNGQLELL